jgi:hypothetical protein
MEKLERLKATTDRMMGVLGNARVLGLGPVSKNGRAREVG